MKKMTGIVLFALSGLALIAAAAAGINSNWSEHLSGDFEVPVRDTQGQGQAIFHLSSDGTSLEYKLIASNIENVFMAHIHRGAPTENGPIVVWLAPSTAPVAGPPGGGRTDGVLAEGTITAANLVGPLAGQPLSALVELMNSGRAYANVHTSDGDATPNEGPGDFPGGEIRGNLTG
jgi:CHRD domain